MLLNNPAKRYQEIYKIYQEAFPHWERRTYETQLEIMEKSCYQLLVKEESNRILAFLGFWKLKNCCFMEHLATTEECRGKGYGRDLVLECIQTADKPIFLEIEPIEESKPMTARRAGFYERLGFHVNHFPYLQMPLKAGDDPCPLWIMSYGKTISEDEFLPFKEEIYHRVYRVSCGNQLF